MQLPLPTVDLRLLCTICKQPADLLGQVHPRLRHLACPACCQKYAVPDYMRPDATMAERSHAVEVETELRGLLIPPQRPQTSTHPTLHISSLQNSLPVCYVCGRVHNRAIWGRYMDTCQHCEDRRQVESLWAQRGIFGGDDPESTLDRMYKAFPDLFERGVLPDYWFELMHK